MLVPQTSALTTSPYSPMERMRGIEPPSLAWKAKVLTVELHSQLIILLLFNRFKTGSINLLSETTNWKFLSLIPQLV